jgi:hypothetical protein
LLRRLLYAKKRAPPKNKTARRITTTLSNDITSPCNKIQIECVEISPGIIWRRDELMPAILSRMPEMEIQ